LIDAYFRTRTNLTSSVSGNALGGKLTTAQGQPIAGAKVQVRLTPLSGDGLMGALVAQGTLPPGTTSILFGIRVNAECGCSGSANVRIAEFRFQPQNGPPTVRTFRNARGVGEWGDMTDSKGVRIANVENGVLHLVARRGQPMVMNSAQTPEHGQGNFTFSVRAQVPAAAVGSGYFAVFLMNDKGELSRTRIPFRPASVPVGTAVTGSDGSWSIRLSGQGENEFATLAQYAGDERYWAAQSGVTESRPPR